MGDTRTEGKKAPANTPTDRRLCLPLDIQAHSVGHKTSSPRRQSGAPKIQAGAVRIFSLHLLPCTVLSFPRPLYLFLSFLMQYSQFPQLKHHSNGTSLLHTEAAEREDPLSLLGRPEMSQTIYVPWSQEVREHVYVWQSFRGRGRNSKDV